MLPRSPYVRWGTFGFRCRVDLNDDRRLPTILFGFIRES